MDGVAVRVAEDLHLDVTRPLHELLEIDLILAEGSHGLATRFRHLAREVLFLADRPHAATAATPRRLQHDG